MTTNKERVETASPGDTVRRWADSLSPVETEEVELSAAVGRVLAVPLVADRDSPPLDVSAMDGYAVRWEDLQTRPAVLPVKGEARIGQPPEELPPQSAIRIVTGAPVPKGANTVLRREWVREHGTHIEVPAELGVSRGQDIRFRGENISAGQIVVPQGTLVTAPILGACAGFGYSRVWVFRRVRVAVLVTGNELVAVDNTVQPWQLRDSNSWSLRGLLSMVPFLELRQIRHIPDDLDQMVTALTGALDQVNLVLMTGGVSMGDTDFVRPALEKIGATIIFHKLPIRPGKPLLGAMCHDRPVIGLPGNPVSVLVTACRFAGMVLRRLAGLSQWEPRPTLVEVNDPEVSNPTLWLYRPVRLVEQGVAEFLPTRGSGDLVSAARSEGFVEIPPNTAGTGVRHYYPWSLI
jgi:molybdopterin molybdotransferase